MEFFKNLYEIVSEQGREARMQKTAENSPAGQRVKALQDEIAALAEHIEETSRQVVDMAQKRKQRG
jgi:hypothetical protein